MPDKILIVHPLRGGIDIYAKKLGRTLANLGWEVEYFNSTENCWPYDSEEGQFKASEYLLKALNTEMERVSWGSYKYLLFNFGKNDIEQAIPYLLKGQKTVISQALYIVHFLSWQLFSDFLGHKDLQEAINQSFLPFFNGYIWFGDFARRTMEESSGRSLDGIVSLLPETHPSQLDEETPLLEKLRAAKAVDKKPFIVLPGYGAKYKDLKLLLDSLNYLKPEVTLYIIGKGWNKKLAEVSSHQAFEQIKHIDVELTPSEFRIACELSDIGLFPYRQPLDLSQETFQGSGTLPNFLALGKPCVILNSASLHEYFTTDLLIANDLDPRKFAKKIELAINLSKNPDALSNYQVEIKDVSMENHADMISEYLINNELT